MQATAPGGMLQPLDKCYIKIKSKTIQFKSIPDISDQKSAEYTDEAVIGRASPMKTYSHSGKRTINLELYFYITEANDPTTNLENLRWIASACYPEDISGGGGPGAPVQANGQGGVPFIPPPVCKLRCGDLLATQDLCVVLMSYSVKFPRDVAFDEDTYCPWFFQVSTSWEVVYKSSDLPGQDRIVQFGR